MKKKLTLLITILSLTSQLTLHTAEAPYLPIQTINHEINYNTLLYNTGKTLGNLFMDSSLMPYFTIQKFTNGLYVWYYYNTRFDSNTPSLVGTYNLKISTDGVSVFPEIIGYYPRTPFFDPSLSCKHSASTAYHYLQPLTEVVSQPIMHPIIEDTLKGRWEALIEVLQKDNSTRQESSSTNATWIKILKVVCQDFNYPFTALDLSFPTKEDAENAPRYTPYAPEDEIKKMEKELSLESTSTERKEFLRNEILFFREFLADLRKGDKDFHYKTLSSQKVAPALPYSTPIKKSLIKEQPITLSTTAEEVTPIETLSLAVTTPQTHISHQPQQKSPTQESAPQKKSEKLQFAKELAPLLKTEEEQNKEAAQQEKLQATKDAKTAKEDALLRKKQLEEEQKISGFKRREEQAQKDREAAKKQKEAAQQAEELAKKTAAAKTVQKAKTVSAAAKGTHKTKSTSKGAAAAGSTDSDDAFLEAESKRVSKETATPAYAIQEQSLTPDLSTQLRTFFQWYNDNIKKDTEIKPRIKKLIHKNIVTLLDSIQTQQKAAEFAEKLNEFASIYGYENTRNIITAYVTETNKKDIWLPYTTNAKLAHHAASVALTSSSGLYTAITETGETVLLPRGVKTIVDYEKTLDCKISEQAVYHSINVDDEKSKPISEALSLLSLPWQVPYFVKSFKTHGFLMLKEAIAMLADHTMTEPLKKELFAEFKKQNLLDDHQ